MLVLSLFSNNLSYVLYYKNWYNKNLFLKKKNAVADVNFSNFLRFYYKSKDLAVEDNDSFSIFDHRPEVVSQDFGKDSLLELKKSFFTVIRHNRKFLSFFFLKKLKRSRTLTKHFSFFKKKNNGVFTLFSLFFLLLGSQLVFTYFDARFLLFNSCIYVNHKLLNSKKSFFVLKPGFFVSLLLHKNFYIYYFYFFKHINSIKFKLYKKVLNLKKNNLSYYKQKSEHYSSKYNLYTQINSTIFSYLEVDFFTLSFFILSTAFIFKFYWSVYSPFFYKTYNWTFTS